MIERHSILPIEDLDKIKSTGSQRINGVLVKGSSQRIKLFKKNKTCVKCGITGEFLAIEIHTGDPNLKKKEELGLPRTYHLNMYAIKDGEEVLMTKDHIIPRSKGGRNVLFNYQTMCITCNQKKGNGDLIPNKTKKNRIHPTWIKHGQIDKHLFHKITDLCELVTYIQNNFTIYHNKDQWNTYPIMYPVIRIETFNLDILMNNLDKYGYYIKED